MTMIESTRRLALSLTAAATAVAATVLVAASAQASPAAEHRPDTETADYCVGAQLIRGSEESTRTSGWCLPDPVIWQAP
ncbi:hypothetical protein [Nocardia sp. NPDC127526]|uniref:hypothetical protein n=1 Tax=Nocardia sp. NPDC127526 TaxID=3345393 RepID=UPI00363838C7